MPAKWFCNKCGEEIWTNLESYMKNDTVNDMEKKCLCSDCMLKKYKNENKGDENIMDEKEKLMKLLNEYYGDHRDDSHKEEIVDFIESNILDIASIFEDAGILPIAIPPCTA